MEGGQRPNSVHPPGPNYTPKARLLAGGVLPHCGKSKPLVAAYFLGDGSAETIAFRRLTPAQALVEWAKNSFLFDIEDKALIANPFRPVALANRMPPFALDYPRRYDHLQNVLAAMSSLLVGRDERPNQIHRLHTGDLARATKPRFLDLESGA